MATSECVGSRNSPTSSVDDFTIVADTMTGGNPSADDRQIPYVRFTDPPSAPIGLSET